jgi:WD40 repeat protein
MSVFRMWDVQKSDRPLHTWRHHSGFVYGLDVSSADPERIADCAWDKTVVIYSKRCALKTNL